MSEEISHIATRPYLGKIEFSISLVFLLLMLIIFDRSSAISFVKILSIFTISSKIIKNHFSHLVIKISKYRKNRIIEYAFSGIFTFFIFIVIEFMLNGLYTHTICIFFGLLVFTCVTLHIVIKNL